MRKRILETFGLVMGSHFPKGPCNRKLKGFPKFPRLICNLFRYLRMPRYLLNVRSTKYPGTGVYSELVIVVFAFEPWWVLEHVGFLKLFPFTVAHAVCTFPVSIENAIGVLASGSKPTNDALKVEVSPTELKGSAISLNASLIVKLCVVKSTLNYLEYVGFYKDFNN